MQALLAALLLAAASALAPQALAERITVFAAASLKETLDDAARAFETKTRHRVAVSYGGSPTLARQIEQGAPADVFICADGEWMDHLERGGFLADGTRRNVAANELVLIAPARSTVAVRLVPRADLAAALGPGRRLAIANPEAVPAGKYARAALLALGAWESVQHRLAPTDNVRAALALVARGEAPLGVVYRTDALAEPRVRVVDAFAASTHAPIVYPMALTRRSKAVGARGFADFLASDAGRAFFERRGFRKP